MNAILQRGLGRCESSGTMYLSYSLQVRSSIGKSEAWVNEKEGHLDLFLIYVFRRYCAAQQKGHFEHDERKEESQYWGHKAAPAAVGVWHLDSK